MAGESDFNFTGKQLRVKSREGEAAFSTIGDALSPRHRQPEKATGVARRRCRHALSARAAQHSESVYDQPYPSRGIQLPSKRLRGKEGSVGFHHQAILRAPRRHLLNGLRSAKGDQPCKRDHSIQHRKNRFGLSPAPDKTMEHRTNSRKLTSNGESIVKACRAGSFSIPCVQRDIQSQFRRQRKMPFQPEALSRTVIGFTPSLGRLPIVVKPSLPNGSQRMPPAQPHHLLPVFLACFRTIRWVHSQAV